jgi:outer membrane receptor protein involved in Fe transport
MSSRLARSLLLVVACEVLPGVPGVMGQQAQVAARGPRFVMAGWASGTEQDASGVPVLRRRVSLDLSGVTVDQALKELTRQAELEISYSARVVAVDRLVSLHAREITVAAALTEILLDAPVDVAVTAGGQLALVRRVRASVRPVPDSGAVTGRVTDAASGSPLAGATVHVEGTRLSATTDGAGRYRIGRVEVGTHALRARYIGYTPASASVEVRVGEEVAADFALAKAAQELNQVVVTGTIVPTEVKALPTPVSVISASDIAQQRPLTFLDVIRQGVPSVVAFHQPGAAPVQTFFSARGVSSLTGTSPMKIFVDGIEATTFTQAPVDPNSIERIEVVRGPQASAIYGADAAGGVIQVFTKHGNPGLARPRIEAQAALGAAQTPYKGYGGVLRQNYTGSVQGGTANVSYNFGGGYTHLGDYVPTGELSRQASPSAYGGMRFTSGIITADLSARYLRNKLPAALNPIVLTTGYVPLSRPLYELDDYTNETYGSRITVQPTNWWWNQLTIGVDRRTHQGVQTQQRFTTPTDTLYAVSDGGSRKISVGYNASVSRRLGPPIGGSLTVGVDHYDQDATSFSTAQALSTEGTIETSPPGSFSNSRITITNTGYFAQAQLSIKEALFLTAGLRAEQNSTFGEALGTPLLPRLGLSFVQPVGNVTVKLRGSWGRAIRAPMPGQAFGTVTATQINLANSGLAPEQQQGWDAGVDLEFGSRASLSVTGYDQTAKDLIVYVQVATLPAPTYQYQNLGRVSNRGIELEGKLAIRPVQLRAQYGYVRSRIEEVGSNITSGDDLKVGDQPPGVPQHTAGAALTIVPSAGTTLTAGMTYLGGFTNPDAIILFRCLGGTGPCPARGFNTNYPGFTKFNAAFTQRLTRGLEGFVSVDNLANNEAYEANNLNPIIGRVMMVGLHLTY